MAAAVDGVDSHAERPHQPGGGDADAAEAQDAAGLAGQNAVAGELVEFAAVQRVMLDQQAFRGGKHHGQPVLRHCLGIGAAVAGDGDFGRKRAERDEVDAGGHELDQAGGLDVLGLARAQVLAGVAGKQGGGVPQRLDAGGIVEIGEVDKAAGVADRIGENRAFRWADM